MCTPRAPAWGRSAVCARVGGRWAGEAPGSGALEESLQGPAGDMVSKELRVRSSSGHPVMGSGWRACAGSLETLPQTRMPGTVGRLGIQRRSSVPLSREKDEVSVMTRASAVGS